MDKGLEALENLMANYYEMCQDLGNNDDQYQRCNLTSERAIIEKALKEHEQHKAIEKELGIDLITFVKLLECQYAKTTICVKTSPRAKKIETKEKLELFADLKTKSMKVKSVARYPTWDTELVYRGCYHSYSFKDYGKTWALTREELEK